MKGRSLYFFMFGLMLFDSGFCPKNQGGPPCSKTAGEKPSEGFSLPGIPEVGQEKKAGFELFEGGDLDGPSRREQSQASLPGLPPRGEKSEVGLPFLASAMPKGRAGARTPVPLHPAQQSSRFVPPGFDSTDGRGLPRCSSNPNMSRRSNEGFGSLDVPEEGMKRSRSELPVMFEEKRDPIVTQGVDSDGEFVVQIDYGFDLVCQIFANSPEKTCEFYCDDSPMDEGAFRAALERYGLVWVEPSHYFAQRSLWLIETRHEDRVIFCARFVEADGRSLVVMTVTVTDQNNVEYRINETVFFEGEFDQKVTMFMDTPQASLARQLKERLVKISLSNTAADLWGPGVWGELTRPNTPIGK